MLPFFLAHSTLCADRRRRGAGPDRKTNRDEWWAGAPVTLRIFRGRGISGTMEAKSTEGDREQQLLDAAEALIRERRTLNLSLGELADRVGVSRSLLYVYFDGVPTIIDALFLQHLDRLGAAILPELDARDATYRERARAAYAAYLDYLIESGPILQVILRERHQDSPLGPESQRRFRRLLRHVADQARRALRLAPREAFVLLELTSGIPEALARLVRAGEIDRETAHATCDRLVLAAVDGFAAGPTG